MFWIFRDHSLKDPVLDKSGKPIVYPPNDDRSKTKDGGNYF